MNTAAEMASMWKAGRRTLERSIEKITNENISNRLTPETNSVGFLLRHIAEVEHGFSHIAFKGEPLGFERKTVGPGIIDTGEHTNAEEIKNMFIDSEKAVLKAFENLKEEEWNDIVELRMGAMTRKEYVGYLIAHSNYHTGQLVLAIKYGKQTNHDQLINSLSR